MAKGYQGPDVEDGLGETSGRVVLRSSRLRVPSWGALAKQETCRLGIKNAPLQTGGFRCGVWDPSGSRRNREPPGPACGLHDAPTGCRKTLQSYLLCAEESLALVGPKFLVSSFDPRL